MKRNKSKMTVDVLQSYTARGLILMPNLEDQFETELTVLKNQGKLSFLPYYQLHVYSHNMQRKLATLFINQPLLTSIAK